MYIQLKLSCCTLKNVTVLFVSYTSIKLKKRKHVIECPNAFYKVKKYMRFQYSPGNDYFNTLFQVM